MTWTSSPTGDWRFWKLPDGMRPEINEFHVVLESQVAPSVLAPGTDPNIVASSDYILALKSPVDPPELDPYTPKDANAARTLADALVVELANLHARGVRLGLSELLEDEDEFVGLIGDVGDEQRILVGGVKNATCGNSQAGVSDHKLPSFRPYSSSSWQAKFTANASEADTSALQDWQALLRVIYYHYTAARLPIDRRTKDQLKVHATRVQKDLASGYANWFRTAFWTADPDILHWGLGVRSGYRGWLRRLESITHT